MSIDTRRRLAVVTSLCSLLLGGSSALAADLTAQEVLKSIEQATRYLASVQQADGSWVSGRNLDYKIGVSSLALLALLNAGMTPDDPPVRNGLKYLHFLESVHGPLQFAADQVRPIISRRTIVTFKIRLFFDFLNALTVQTVAAQHDKTHH